MDMLKKLLWHRIKEIGFDTINYHKNFNDKMLAEPRLGKVYLHMSRNNYKEYTELYLLWKEYRKTKKEAKQLERTKCDRN